jgi:hypothetical protein
MGPRRCRQALGGLAEANADDPGNALTMESEMFASENCTKVGCLLEAASPGIAPAVALVWMLSIAAFSSWAM